jgi:hypothetical protein
MQRLTTFAREHLGLELYPGQTRVLEDWAASGKRKAVLCLGRRSGKGIMSSAAAIYNAVATDYSGFLRPSETRFIVVVATRQEQARESIRVILELLRAAPDPDLVALVDMGASTLDEVVFKTGAVIRAMPCSARSTRGLPISLLIMDEAAHMVTTEDGFAAGKQVYQALVPSTAQFGERGYVMLTSTPNWRSGIFWDLYRAGSEGTVGDVFVVQHPTWDMNPAISRESLESEFRADPDSAAREYGANFSAASGAYLDPVDVLACVRKGVGVLAPDDQLSYRFAIDPAFSRDAFAAAAAHKEGETVVIDGVWTWHRNGFERTLDEVVEVARKYRVRTLRTDQFSSQAVIEGLQRRGMSCDAKPWDNLTKYEAYSRLKAALNTRMISLPDDHAVIQELLTLEARPTPSGATRIAAAGSAHDDRASVLAALMDTLVGTTGELMVFDANYGGYLPGRGDFIYEDGEMVFAEDQEVRCCGTTWPKGTWFCEKCRSIFDAAPDHVRWNATWDNKMASEDEAMEDEAV